MKTKERANLLNETLKDLQRFLQNYEITLIENDMFGDLEEIEKKMSICIVNPHELRKRIGIDTSISGKGLVALSQEEH
jgi:hypothetical protein